MTFVYEALNETAREQIATSVPPEPAPPDYVTLLPAWEADHYGHELLLAQAVQDGNEDAAAGHRQAMADLEQAILTGRQALAGAP